MFPETDCCVFFPKKLDILNILVFHAGAWKRGGQEGGPGGRQPHLNRSMDLGGLSGRRQYMFVKFLGHPGQLKEEEVESRQSTRSCDLEGGIVEQRQLQLIPDPDP